MMFTFVFGRNAPHNSTLALLLMVGALLGCGDENPEPEYNPATALGEPDLDGWDGTAAPELTAATLPAALAGLDADFYQGVPCGAYPEDLVDLVVPRGAGAARKPLFLYFHGGGFNAGSRTEPYSGTNADDLRDLVEAGVVYASADYRLLVEGDSSGVIKPLQDGQVCLQYLRLHAAELGIDPDRVVVAGSSAGAGMALWLGTASEMGVRDHALPVLRQSTRVSGVVALETQATYDLVRWDADVFTTYRFDLLGLAVALGLEGRLLDFYRIADIEDIDSPETLTYRQAVDMLALMSGDDPPMFAWNRLGSVFPFTTDAAFHHPDHVRAIVDRASAVGATVVAYAPGRRIADPSGEGVVDFARRVLEVTP